MPRRHRRPSDDEGDRKRKEVLRLRRLGHSFPEIAERLGCTRQNAQYHYRRAVTAFHGEIDKLAEICRAEELDRLDVLWRRWWPKAVRIREPDSEAARICLQLSDRRRKLLGADPPTKVASTNPNGSPIDLLAVDPVAGLARVLALIDAARARGSDTADGDTDGDGDGDEAL